MNENEWLDSAEYSCEILEDKLKQITADRDRLRKRDCNATVELCYDDGDNPFAREQLVVVDVGVSDNCYVVESKVLNTLKAERDRLREIVKATQCPKCDGCGFVADTDEQEPWSDWLNLPLKNSVAVVLGIVKKIPCPECQTGDPAQE